MKKKIISLSIVAAMGMVAGAVQATPTVKANGVGTVNIIPYYSAQGQNVSQISITNTDTANGKAVKVRFRGAEWSDDIFDFTVFLSPGDVFTGAVSNNGSDVAKFETADGSCTLPNSVNQAFPTDRLHNKATGTLEGYIEIITMADIPKNGTKTATTSGGLGINLYDAIKHVDGVAPCKTAGSDANKLINGLDEDNYLVAAGAGSIGQNTDWMVAPRTGLTSWARVIEIEAVKAFGVPATAIDFLNGASNHTQKAYFRQANEVLTAAANLTTDYIFFNAVTSLGAAGTGTGSPITKMYQFDMPDLSTPIDLSAGAGAAAVAATHRNNMTTALQKTHVMTEYTTLAEVNGSTDVVLNQPTRRYYYTYQAYTGTGAEGTAYSRTVGTGKYMIDGETSTPYADAIEMDNRIVLADLKTAGYSSPAVFFDREERSVVEDDDIVISPTPPTADYSVSIKGEAAVISFNRGTGATETGALGAKLTMNNIDIVGSYNAGWMFLSTVAESTKQNLPIIGFTAMNVAGGDNYGTTLPLRYFGATSNRITQ